MPDQPKEPGILELAATLAEQGAKLVKECQEPDYVRLAKINGMEPWDY